MPYLPTNQPLTLAALSALLADDEPVRLAPAGGTAPPAAATPPAPLLVATPAPAAQVSAAELLLTYAVGTGPDVPAALVRRLLLLQTYRLTLSPLSAGPALGRRLLDFFSRDVWPVVPAQGALGPASNHIPLAHLSLPLLGLGEVHYQGYRLAAADVLGLFGWEPVAVPGPEAPFLLAGPAFTLAYATEALARTTHLLAAAEAIGALTAAATDSADFTAMHRTARAALTPAQQAVEAAINAPAPTEPALPAPDELLTAAPGGAAALWLAPVTRGVAAVGQLAARRTARLVAGTLAAPPELAAGPASNYGLRALPLAAASLVAHNQRLVAAAGGAAEALQVLENTEQLLGLELLAAAQALDQQPIGGSETGRAAVAAFRAHATFAAAPRPLAPDLLSAARFVREYAWA